MRLDPSAPGTRGLAVAILAVVLGAPAAYWLVLAPALREIEALEGRVRTQERERDATLRLARELERVREPQAAAAGDAPPAAISSLPAWIEKRAREMDLAGSLRQISPLGARSGDGFRERASLRMDGLDMASALRFLDLVESTPGLRIVTGELRREPAPATGVSLSVEIGLI